MSANEELNVSEVERSIHCVCTVFTVPAWLQEEKECDPGEVGYGLLVGLQPNIKDIYFKYFENLR